MSDDAEGARQLALRCAWCDRVRGEDDAWLTLPSRQLKALEDANLLTHGMCPRCFVEEMNRMAPEERGRQTG